MTSKERLLNVVNRMDESEIMQILEFIDSKLVSRPMDWNDVEVDDPTPDEVAVFTEYYNSERGRE